MQENFSIFDFEIELADMEKIKTLDLHKSQFFDHRDVNMIKWMAERTLS
jgi:diketogulonate reductase-like aldo/keto reductase